MKTFFIDLDSLSSEVFKELLGFTLTVGLKFRKIDLIKDDKTSRVLVIEVETKAEDKALNDFLNKNDIENPITISKTNKASINSKEIGILKQLGKNAIRETYYQDKSTGKRFIITK